MLPIRQPVDYLEWLNGRLTREPIIAGHPQVLASDPVAYFADPANQDLAVVKPLRKSISRLDLSPFPI
jgi:hypothetical protein